MRRSSHRPGVDTGDDGPSATGSAPDDPTLDVTHAGPNTSADLREGDAIDRYRILRRLGAGGMGEVYLAYDPKLDRQIALKLLLRTDADGETEARLQREAMALARLSHPNVVAIHDVGHHAGSTFITMEYVKGHTLQHWLRTQPRSWREALEVIMAAGRGLAAAHDAGLIHRDFKPGNVIVGDDGRVRVLDFGLAREHGALDEPSLSGAVDPSTSDPRPLRSDVTRAGILIGTPGYMAPEQIAGGYVDSRSDQFAFCVVLYRALFADRPFEGKSAQELAEAIEAGALRPIPKSSPVPAAVRRAITRGLSATTARRHEDMHALLDALQRGAKMRTRWILGGASLIATAGLLAAWWSTNGPSRCATAGSAIGDVWNDERRARIRESFTSTQKPYADDTAERVIESLDRYARAWSTAGVDACEATHVRHTQSATLLDRRMLCLDERRLTLEALLRLFENVDPEGLGAAGEATANLPALQDCEATNVAGDRLPPEPAEHRDRIATIRERLAHSRAQVLASKSADGLRTSSELLDEAEAIAYDPLTAQVLLQMANASFQVGGPPEVGKGYFERCIRLAERSGDERTAVEAMQGLARQQGARLGNPGPALWLAQHAHARAQRVGMTARGQQSLYLTHGAMLFQNDRIDEAIEVFRQQLDTTDDSAMGRFYRVSALQNLGAAYGRTAEYEESNRLLRQALAEGEEYFGPDHPRLAMLHINLANNDYQMGRHASAIKRAHRAEELLIVDGGDGAPDLAYPYQVLGANYHRMGDHERALHYNKKAYEQQRRTLGDTHPAIGSSLGNIASTLTDLGRPDEALPYIDQALALYEKTEGAQSRRLAVAWDTRGTALAALGRTQEALEEYEKALKHVRRLGQEDYSTAHIEWGYGKSLWQVAKTDEERREALTYVRNARQRFIATSADPPSDVEEIDAWLGSLPDSDEVVPSD